MIRGVYYVGSVSTRPLFFTYTEFSANFCDFVTAANSDVKCNMVGYANLYLGNQAFVQGRMGLFSSFLLRPIVFFFAADDSEKSWLIQRNIKLGIPTTVFRNQASVRVRMDCRNFNWKSQQLGHITTDTIWVPTIKLYLS